MSQRQGTRPYLEGLDAPTDMQVVIDWATYLGTTFGTAGGLAALRYYEDIGWIGASARRTLESHLGGLSLEELHSKKYDEPGLLSEPLESLSGTPFGAHAKSLEFIAELAGEDLEAGVIRRDMAVHQADVDLAEPGQHREHGENRSSGINANGQ